MALGTTLAHGQSAPPSVITPLHGAGQSGPWENSHQGHIEPAVGGVDGQSSQIRLTGASPRHPPTRHVSDKAERQTRLKKSYANVVKSRAKRALRVWLRHASLAHAKRMKYMESKVSRRERVVDERYGRYVFHAWRWHVAWSRGYAETVAENLCIANAERTRRRRRTTTRSVAT